MSRQGTEDFSGSEITLYDTTMIDTYHYTFVKTHRMYNTKSELSELWVIMMCPCPFIHCNKCITLVGMLITGKAMHVWGRKYMGILCTLLSVLL